MKKALITIFSDGSNTSLDYTKVLGGMAFAVFLSLSIYTYGYHNSTWDPMNWSTAISVLLGAIGGVSKIKDFTNESSKPKE
jgi:amino acid permease